MAEKRNYLSSENIKILKEGFHFLHMEELKKLFTSLILPTQGKKDALIFRILHFVKTGDVINNPKVPSISCALKGKIYPLEVNTLILKGSYKSDLKTRIFFKKLIGDDFHFTAFGIDWINNR